MKVTNPWPIKTTDLSMAEARLIKYLRVKRHTHRSLSEVFCNIFYPKAKPWPKCRGNQMHGYDLCIFASKILKEEPWE